MDLFSCGWVKNRDIGISRANSDCLAVRSSWQVKDVIFAAFSLYQSILTSLTCFNSLTCLLSYFSNFAICPKSSWRFVGWVSVLVPSGGTWSRRRPQGRWTCRSRLPDLSPWFYLQLSLTHFKLSVWILWLIHINNPLYNSNNSLYFL